ncbi:hypothetical protein AAHC03_01392 [Spirometra sp. Aus1]
MTNPETSAAGSEGSLLPEVRKYSVVNPRTSMDAHQITHSKGMGCCSYILLGLSYCVILLTFPISILFCIKVIAEYERAVLFRLGRILPGGARGPGLFFTVPCLDMIRKVDLRTVTFDVPPQEVLTKDSVTVAVDAVVYYRIYNPVVAITNVEDADRSTRLLAATTLRNVLGTKNLSEILSERESISSMMQAMLDEATDPWGVKVERVEVKDVRLPVQLQRAMAAEAEAAREARAKVIAAEGEQKASQALKEAADVINESPFAIQLRYLQTLSTISAEKNSTIIFPLPVDLLTHFMRKSSCSANSTVGFNSRETSMDDNHAFPPTESRDENPHFMRQTPLQPTTPRPVLPTSLHSQQIRGIRELTQNQQPTSAPPPPPPLHRTNDSFI